MTERLSITCIAFSRDALQEQVRRACDAPEDSEPPDQVRYLGSYLSNDEVGARTLVVERPYVDRHFLEEYAHYYATGLRPPPPKATRLHFFRSALSNEQMEAALRKAASGDFDDASNELTNDYLGFSVIRPLPSAPIGRTILATYGSHHRRRCYALPPAAYEVHLAGLRLQVRGIPFQQQEQAVGACATTAVWSTLARVMRSDGGRAPTPFEVTEAATKHYLSDRAFPAASGLEPRQILEAFRHFGYSPLYFEPKTEQAQFQLAVKTYVRSGIPVVLHIDCEDQSSAHAVAVVGFRENDEEAPATEIEQSVSPSRKLRARGLSRLYVHDDRLGPYARATWEDSNSKFLKLKFHPKEPEYSEYERPADIIAAMVPLYPKLRLSAQDLLGFAAQVQPLVAQLVPCERDRLLVDLRFALAGDFLRSLFASGTKADRAATIARSAVLSRYVGIIAFYLGDDYGDEPLVQFVCDSTDIRRDVPAAAPLIVVVPRFDEHLPALQAYFSTSAPNALVI